MAEITAEVVRQLRDETNVSMMECKKALEEAGGDLAKATTILRKRGVAVAAKKASRAANQGLIVSATTDGGKVVSLVEVNCETDFVAKNDSFKKLTDQIATKACQSETNLAEQMKDAIVTKIAEMGENIVVGKSARYALNGKGRVASYIHQGGKVGVLVEIGCENSATEEHATFKELVKDVTLQVAASSPRYLVPADVPADVIAAEREIYASQVKDKPAQIVDKIVDGKLKKFYSEVCLIDQIFVKDSKLAMNALLAAKGKELGDKLTIRRFIRFQIGK
jgi:elongation factor Ts